MHVDLDVHCSMLGAANHTFVIYTCDDDFQQMMVKCLILSNQVIMAVFQQMGINCLEKDGHILNHKNAVNG